METFGELQGNLREAYENFKETQGIAKGSFRETWRAKGKLRETSGKPMGNLRGNLRETKGKPQGNQRETKGKPKGNLRETWETSWEPHGNLRAT